MHTKGIRGEPDYFSDIDQRSYMRKRWRILDELNLHFIVSSQMSGRFKPLKFCRQFSLLRSLYVVISILFPVSNRVFLNYINRYDIHSAAPGPRESRPASDSISSPPFFILWMTRYIYLKLIQFFFIKKKTINIFKHLFLKKKKKGLINKKCKLVL